MTEFLGFHLVNALPPVADIEEGGMLSDVVNAQGAGILFVYYTGVNAGGDSTITVQACDTVTPRNTTAVPFIYRANVATDVWGAWTAATTAGFTSSQVSNAVHQIYVDGAELAEEGYGYARLVGVEDTDNTCLGGILAFVLKGRYEVAPATLIT